MSNEAVTRREFLSLCVKAVFALPLIGMLNRFIGRAYGFNKNVSAKEAKHYTNLAG